MYKLIAAGILCIMLTACGDEKGTERNTDAENRTTVSGKESESNISGGEILTDITENNAANVTNEEGQEKIINILNELQQDETLSAFNFYENNMYVLTKSEGGIILRKYNMDIWEEISVGTGIDDGDAFALVPNSTGIVVKRNYFSENCDNYVFDEELNRIAECQGLLADYSAKGGTLYYYDSGEGIVYGKEVDSGKINIIRELVAWERIDEAKDEDDIIMIEELAVSNDGDYIFYVGLCYGKDRGENVWGYFDIDNIENDTMYKENKTLRVSENSIIVMDSVSGSYMMGEEPVLSKDYHYFFNGKEKESRQLKNSGESDHGVYSCEGNVFLTRYYDKSSALNTVIIYNMTDNKIIEEYTDDNDMDWVLYGCICEKFRIILDKYPIHESPDVFSPTGKFEILSMTW